MLPVIALVGRPNVGKSTLFNRLTRSRDAIVADQAGLTRDRQYGRGHLDDQPFIVIDTGGIGEGGDGIETFMEKQSQQAINEAHIVLFMVDARAGLTGPDEVIAKNLRSQGKKVYLVANKIDGLNAELVLGEFYQMGLGEPIGIAASHGRGVNVLIEKVIEEAKESDSTIGEEEETIGIKLAIVGRPNVGKSTLVNRMLGEERVVVFDEPGTTRDSIHIPMERRDQQYTLIDTAGVRRRTQVDEAIEKFSVIKTLQSIESANVVIMVVDAHREISNQDMHLLGFIIETGKSLVVAINKWDGMENSARDFLKKEIDRKLMFVNFARMHFISALHGTGVGHLFESVDEAYEAATQQLSTSRLTRILEDAVVAHPPPLVRGRRVKMRYAHPGGKNPPIIVIHGNQLDDLPDRYNRYLINTYRKSLNMIGTPIKMQYKTSENPFKGRRNVLTVSQERQRKRMMKHVKKK